MLTRNGHARLLVIHACDPSHQFHHLARETIEQEDVYIGQHANIRRVKTLASTAETDGVFAWGNEGLHAVDV
jgi:hypothetical protein